MHIERYIVKNDMKNLKIKIINNESKVNCEGKINGGVDMNANALQRPCTILQSIEESFNEVKLIREGKLPKKTWKELREEKRKKQEK